MLRHYLVPDRTHEPYPLKYLAGADVIKCKNGLCEISTLHMPMKYMAEEGRKKNITRLLKKTSEDEVNKYYRKVSFCSIT